MSHSKYFTCNRKIKRCHLVLRTIEAYELTYINAKVRTKCNWAPNLYTSSLDQICDLFLFLWLSVNQPKKERINSPRIPSKQHTKIYPLFSYCSCSLNQFVWQTAHAILNHESRRRICTTSHHIALYGTTGYANKKRMKKSE